MLSLRAVSCVSVRKAPWTRSTLMHESISTRCPGHLPGKPTVIAFLVPDMTSPRCASAVTRAVKAEDRSAVVQVDLATHTVEIEPGSASARQLSDAILRAGYSPTAA